MGKGKNKHKKKSSKHKKKNKHQSSSDSDSSSEEEWVEMASASSLPQKNSEKPKELKKEDQTGEFILGKAHEDQKDWLMNSALFACISREEIRQTKEKKKNKNEDDKYMLDKVGQTDRELNPYWKDGGSGLPEQSLVAPESLRQASVTVGDQGVAWLRKALQRAKEQAAEQGRSLDQVVAERWGSLEKLQGMIAEAEKREINNDKIRHQSTSRNRSSRDKSDYDYKYDNRSHNPHKKENNCTKQNQRYDEDPKYKSKSFKKPKGSDSESSDDHKNYKRERESSGYKRNDKFVKSYDRNIKEEGRNVKNERNVDSRSRHSSIHRRSSSSSSSSSNSSSSSSSENEVIRKKSSKNSDDDDRFKKYDKRISKSKQRRKRHSSSSSSSSHRSSYHSRVDSSKNKEKHDGKREVKKTFMKPHQDSDSDSFVSSDKKQSEKPKSYSSSSSKGWRKKNQSTVKEDNIVSNTKEDSPVPESASRVEEGYSPTVEKPQILTDKEMNELGAKLVKAELLGNHELVKELKTKLDSAREAKANAPKESEETEQVVILTHTDSRGFTRPVSLSGTMEPTGGRRKAKKVETHSDGKRMRYFADDDKYSLQEMFQREKLSTVEDSNAVFAKLASKGVGRDDSTRDMDDVFVETARMEEADGRKHAREKQQAVEQSKRTARSLENCQWCLESKQMLKHLIIAMGQTCYLCVPPYQSITEHHCLLVPSHHTPCATQLDEDVWKEMQDFRKKVVQMFLTRDEDVVFFESARYLNKFPHMVLNCVPMPKETGDLAPIYFKKAIQECEMEWSNNKKLVDLRGRDVRRAVPRGLPYFSVDFGMDSGFAHVIEDEKLFPQNFAQEIIGGMLDLDHTIWRKQRRQTFEEQSKKVIQLNKLWSQLESSS